MIQWPTQAEVLSNKSPYGDPRSKDRLRMSPGWEAKNIIYITPPFRMTYAGEVVKRIRVHKFCAASLGRVFDDLLAAAKAKDTANPQKVLDHWGVSIFGGCVMYRLMRGSNRPSIHSYGAAIDLDPARNGLGDTTPRFAQFPEVLAAFAKEGWMWGGKWSRPDGMHWQATR
ncbi:MAG: M15 family metallopeptidase [Pseudomonas sp.]